MEEEKDILGPGEGIQEVKRVTPDELANLQEHAGTLDQVHAAKPGRISRILRRLKILKNEDNRITAHITREQNAEDYVKTNPLVVPEGLDKK
jgi:hypothetical protein